VTVRAHAEGGYRFDGREADELAASLGLPRVETYDAVASTMDVAHALAQAGAAAGTLVLAERQTAGRGRAGKSWASGAGLGLWLTIVERPEDARALDVLSLRVGLEVAAALEPLVDGAVALKWPNDLYVGAGKLAGVLVEARWRDARPDWVAIGFGLNVTPPADVPGAAGLRPGVARLTALGAVVPAIRRAAAARGPLDARELDAFARRDRSVGRAIVSPAAGIVRGITPDGALRVADAGVEVTARGGSLIYQGDEEQAR
jgi:BirA family transcriptional regulator, biotin operon repressor / biotin---[acetyl-CoA-carboxylase] ligase